MNPRLSNRFFAIYGFIQLLGVMSFVVPVALVAWATLTIVLLIAVLVDRRQLAKASDVTASVLVPRDPRLSEATAIEITFTVNDRRWFIQGPVRLLAPRIPLLEFKTPSIEIDPRHQPREKYVHTFKAKVTDLGYVKVENVEMKVSSPAGMFVLDLSIPVKPVEFRAVPERRKLAEQAFQELIQTQKILYQGARRV
ncbi:MAG: hypothetical protein AAB250_18130, partial [Bdellovibrionota bacterium]